jgi:hypothetical protein
MARDGVTAPILGQPYHDFSRVTRAISPVV